MDSSRFMCLTHGRHSPLSPNKSTLDGQTFRKPLRVADGWRSRALHAGFVMPWAMVEPSRIADGTIQNAPIGQEAHGRLLLDRAAVRVLAQTLGYARPPRRVRTLLRHPILTPARQGVVR